MKMNVGKTKAVVSSQARAQMEAFTPFNANEEVDRYFNNVSKPII